MILGVADSLTVYNILRLLDFRCLFLIGAFAGPVTQYYFQNEMSDPSFNYTTLISAPHLPTFLASLPNGTVSELLQSLYLYDGNINASVESSALSYGASIQNASYYAEVQAIRASDFANNASNYYSRITTLTQQVLDQSNLTGSLSATAYNQGQELLLRNGMPENISALIDAFSYSKYINVTTLEMTPYQSANVSEAATLSSIPDLGQNLATDSEQQSSYLTSVAVHPSTLSVEGVPTGTTISVFVDGKAYDYQSGFPTFMWQTGSVHMFVCEQSEPYGIFNNYVFSHWQIGNQSISSCEYQLAVAGSTTISAVYGVSLNLENIIITILLVLVAVASSLFFVVKRSSKNGPRYK